MKRLQTNILFYSFTHVGGLRRLSGLRLDDAHGLVHLGVLRVAVAHLAAGGET